jgi:hypothetical protein
VDASTADEAVDPFAGCGGAYHRSVRVYWPPVLIMQRSALAKK